MRGWVIAILLLSAAGCRTTDMHTEGHMTTEEPDVSRFTTPTVSFGIVVSDIDKAAEFYTKGLGFTEVEGFHVPEGMARDSGLTDGRAFDVRVFVLEAKPNATHVKLMQFPDTPSATQDNTYIHSTLGVSYLTVMVSDVAEAVERARKAGAEPLAKGPIDLPDPFPKGIYLALVRDPDGNLIEFVGPRK